MQNVIRLYRVVLVSFTFLNVSPLRGQQTNEEIIRAGKERSDSVKAVDAKWCSTANTVDKKLYTTKLDYQQALHRIGKCKLNDAARILVNLWKDPSYSELGILQELSLGKVHESVFSEVIRIVKDRTQSDDRRMAALSLMAGYTIPDVINVNAVPNTTPRRSWDTAATRRDEFLMQITRSPHIGRVVKLPNVNSRVNAIMKEIVDVEPRSRLGIAAAWVVYQIGKL